MRGGGKIFLKDKKFLLKKCLPSKKIFLYLFQRISLELLKPFHFQWHILLKAFFLRAMMLSFLLYFITVKFYFHISDFRLKLSIWFYFSFWCRNFQNDFCKYFNRNVQYFIIFHISFRPHFSTCFKEIYYFEQTHKSDAGFRL